MGIAWLAFYSMCSFTLLSTHIIEPLHLESGISDTELFVIPGLSHEVEVTNRHTGRIRLPGLEQMDVMGMEAEPSAAGVVVNNFENLEAEYIELHGKAVGKRIGALVPLLSQR